MATRLGRRNFLVGVVAGTAVLAFDPCHHAWITTAHADHPDGISIPELDGELIVETASLAEAADDFGHIVQRTPVAVLRPGSRHDIRTLIQFANHHHIQVAMRGQGHSMFGQAQAEAGVIIDSRTLHTIHHIDANTAVVDAGVRWGDLLTATLAQGRTPPVLTDFLELSVGGVLQVGGIGGHAHRAGFVVDSVRALQVVTGEGHLLTCSPSHEADLFHAVLGGLGQFGLIIQAHIQLIPAPTQARVLQLFYTDLDQYVADQHVVVMDERFSYLEGQVVPASGNGWMFMLEAARYYTPPQEPDNTALLDGLRPDAGTMIQEFLYVDWQNRLAPVVTALRQNGVWSFPHPWFNVFLPGSQVVAYVRDVLAHLSVARHRQRSVFMLSVPAQQAAPSLRANATGGGLLPCEYLADGATGHTCRQRASDREPDTLRAGAGAGWHALPHWRSAVQSSGLASTLWGTLAAFPAPEGALRSAPSVNPRAGDL